jgi:hypothetical protein
MLIYPHNIYFQTVNFHISNQIIFYTVPSNNKENKLGHKRRQKSSYVKKNQSNNKENIYRKMRATQTTKVKSLKWNVTIYNSCKKENNLKAVRTKNIEKTIVSSSSPLVRLASILGQMKQNRKKNPISQHWSASVIHFKYIYVFIFIFQTSAELSVPVMDA